SGKEALGVQRSIAQKLEERAVEVVGAGFGGDQHGGTRAGAVFRGVVVGQHLEFLNVVDRGKSPDSAGRQLVVVHAIQQPIGAVGSGTADRQGEGAACSHFAVRSTGEKTAGSRF